MPKKIFIWVAHPRPGSLCTAIADAYQEEAKRKGAEVRRIDLVDMRFDPHFEGYKGAAALEPDLIAWQEAVGWADHLFVVHPYWWGAMPTQAKAVLDRALTPGFAYKYHKRGVKWDKLLTGKTADAIITSDTPPLLDTFLYNKPARRVLKNQVLGFCGIATRKMVQFGSVKLATPKKIEGWLAKAARMGGSAAARIN
ncbi:MAG: NAD(P)H-dependent oxidoreductase [Pseudomonadota bacterium]